MSHFFLSTIVSRVDKHCRLFVASAFRSVIASNQTFQGVVVFHSFTLKTIEAFCMDRMEVLSQELENLDWLFENQGDVLLIIFANAKPLSFDDNGRIALSERLQIHGHITDQIACVEWGATFQRNLDLLTPYQQQAREYFKQRQASLAGLSEAP